MTLTKRRRHIVHIVYSFSEGGLENVIVQLINRLPREKFEHTIISLTDISTFKYRITISDVKYIELNKKPGHAIPLYPKIFRILNSIKPDVVHSCNFAALEIAPLSWLARVPMRIHAEHGWDAHDPEGESVKYQQIRKLYKLFVNKYIAVSKDIDNYLEKKIRIPSKNRLLITNGVDTNIFFAKNIIKPNLNDSPFDFNNYWVVGTVGRLQIVKNQLLLAHAFVSLISAHPEMKNHVRLVIVGEGILREKIEKILVTAKLMHLAWLPGVRSDVAKILQNFDCFVLPSQAEGTSCTLQEAMACELPVIATHVGGNAELIGYNCDAGKIISPNNEAQLVDAIRYIFNNPKESALMGAMARKRILEKFSVESMIENYKNIFL